MDNRLRQRGVGKKGLIDRLDHATREVNALLLVLAIGLAILDFTCFFAMQVRDALPSPARAAAHSLVVPKSHSATRPVGGSAAVGPTRPVAAETGE